MVSVRAKLWLSTNRHAVDVRISSIALGIGEIDLRNPASGAPVALGRGLGCLEAVVSDLEVDNITETSATATITLDRKVGTFTVYWRRYRDDGPTPSLRSQRQVSVASTDVTLTGLTNGVTYRFDASTDEHFPSIITCSITFTAGDADSGTSDHREEEVHLLEDTGVGIIACDEGEDVVIGLHGHDGEELNRYLVDVLPASATSAVEPAPSDRAGRVCVASTTPSAFLFSVNDDGEVTVSALGSCP